MVFYLVYHKKCDDLIFSYIRERRLDEAAATARLYGLLHPEAAVKELSGASSLETVRCYIGQDAVKSSKLNAVLEAMLEAQEMDAKALQGAKQAQGIGTTKEED